MTWCKRVGFWHFVIFSTLLDLYYIGLPVDKYKSNRGPVQVQQPILWQVLWHCTHLSSMSYWIFIRFFIHLVDSCFNTASWLINLHHLQWIGLVLEMYTTGSNSLDRNMNSYLEYHWKKLMRKNRSDIYFFGLEISLENYNTIWNNDDKNKKEVLDALENYTKRCSQMQ